MAYSDIQNRVSQIRMADQILLAQEMSDEEKYKKKKELKKQVRKTPKQRQSEARGKDPKFQGGSPGTVFVPPDGPTTDQDIQDALQDEDMRQGDYLEDPEQPFNINTLLQIGGAIGGGVVPLLQQLLIRNPNAMALTFEEAGFGEGGFVSTEKPNIYINSGAEAYILEPNGNFKFDGMYDPKRHGKTFPGLGLVQNQSNNNMKIAKLPHTPPTEKIVLPNGKLMDSPLRFKTDQERIKFMEDFSRGYGRYSQKNTPMTTAQIGADGAHTNVRIYEEKDGYGNTYKRVLPYFGVGYGGPIRPKKV